MLEDMMPEIGCAMGLGALTAIWWDINFFKIQNTLKNKFKDDHLEMEKYENELRENRNTVSGFARYYLGYVGRQVAYKEIRKVNE